jgi:hypothetical protein
MVPVGCEWLTQRRQKERKFKLLFDAAGKAARPFFRFFFFFFGWFCLLFFFGCNFHNNNAHTQRGADVVLCFHLFAALVTANVPFSFLPLGPSLLHPTNGSESAAAQNPRENR